MLRATPRLQLYKSLLPAYAQLVQAPDGRRARDFPQFEHLGLPANPLPAQTTSNNQPTEAQRAAAYRAPRTLALNVEPEQLYPIEVDGVPGLRISDWAIKENMEDPWYGYIRDFDLGWKNIEHNLPKNGRPVCLFKVRSPRTDRPQQSLEYAHNLILSSSGRPLMLGHLICQFVKAQWRDYQAVTNQVLELYVGRQGGPRTREEASAYARLVPLDELYIVAVMRANVNGIEGWFPKIERRPKAKVQVAGGSSNGRPTAF
ncbi:hypothetical protein C8T65DRAFT_830895 [Cerioporus squamosus]|nr:hypothetical protein C8T65DRAFT_830895 [Cerioporus squamosus]